MIRPEKPGYYWAHDSRTNEWHIVHVNTKNLGGAIGTLFWVTFCGDEWEYKMEIFDAWIGPLQSPTLS